MTRIVLLSAALVILLIAGLLVSLTVFLNGAGLRERVEAALTRALRRPVSIDSLQFTLATGSAVAHGLRIADDPRIGPQPFVQADDVRLGLALWPLLTRREVQIGSIVLRHPQIRLIRNGAGVWNFATLGRSGEPTTASAASSPRHSRAALAVSRLAISNGEILVQTPTADGTPQARVYNGIDVELTHLDRTGAVPFRVAARLPASGFVQATGTAAGLWGSQNPEISAHLLAIHLDLAAAGLVRTTSRVSAILQRVEADVHWSTAGLHVTRITAELPSLHIGLAQHAPSGPAHPSVWTDLLRKLQVDSATIHAASVLIDRQDGTLALHQLSSTTTHWAPGTPAHFNVTANVGGGSIAANGSFTTTTADVQTHFTSDAQLRLHRLDLAAVLPRTSSLRGVADADFHLLTSPGEWTADGTARVDRLILAHNGTPAPGPMLAALRLHQRSGADATSTGTIDRADIAFGGAQLHIGGAYRLVAPAAQLNLHIAGQAMPIDGIESFLPSTGIQLPQGSRLSGGTLSLDLTAQGTPADLYLDGPVHVEGTHLNGFNLGGKLSSLARFTGGRLGSTGGSGTSIRSLSFQLHTGGGQVTTDALTADVAGIGRITGAGSVGSGATLHYTLLLRLEELTAGAGGGGSIARGIASALPPAWAQRALGIVNALANGAMRNGIPILVGGTASHPVISPNIGALLPAETPRTAPEQHGPLQAPQRGPWPAPPSNWPGTHLGTHPSTQK